MKSLLPYRSRCLLVPLALLTCGIGLVGCGSTPFRPLPPNAIPPVIAVTAFENRSGYPGSWLLGDGMADLLVEALVESEQLTVVERRQLEEILEELTLRDSEFFRAEGQAAAALRPARYLIRGTITDFTQVAGGSFWLSLRRWWIFGGKGSVARVALVLTLVDVETGEIVDSVHADGRAAAAEAFAEAGYEGVAFGGDAFFRTPLGKATREAIRKALRGVLEQVPRTYWRPMVAAVAADEVVINGGFDRGLREGLLFRVRDRARPITDPQTGNLLALRPGPVRGVVRVHRVEPTVAYASAVRGVGFTRGQWLEPWGFENPDGVERAPGDRDP